MAQANFLLQENPQLTRALQNAQSPQEANRLMADAWKFAGYNRPGGENAPRLATTQAYANSFGDGGGGAFPALAASREGSMGSTAQRGGFGLNGIVGQGAAMPGQTSPMPSVASLSAQPTALAPDPAGFSSDPAAQPQQPSNQYAQIGNALKAAAAGQQKQGQKGGMMQLAQPGRPSPIGLQQAKAMFDPGRFYRVLRDAGLRGV
ncbi:hypothetical protein [Methylobacterium oryzae]|uniref:hypothetical protein n=1 Tax=Methylobacterium oryzae TaxID=334852 RepID=UPI002F3602DE